MGRLSPLGVEGTAISFRDTDEHGRKTTAMVRARDENGDWRVKRFPVTSWTRQGQPVIPDEAKSWAKATRRDFIVGVDVAGPGTIQDFLEAVAEKVGSEGATPGRCDLIRAVGRSLAAANITEIRALGFGPGVRRWLDGLKDGWSMDPSHPFRHKNRKSISPATKNKILIIIKQATRLAVLRRKIAFDPMLEFNPFKQSKFLKPVFSIEELRRMVSDAARNHTVTEKETLEAEIQRRGGTRSTAIQAIAAERQCHWTTIYNILKRETEPDPWWLACCLLVYTGCRSQEAMHLRWEWIRWDAKVITLKLADDYDSKSDAERIIPLEPELAAILRPIAQLTGHILPPDIRAGGSGFKRNNKVGKGARDYTEALRRYLNRIGMDAKDRSAHSLRHSYITIKLARADTNVERLRKAVGHASFSTTMGYGKLSQLFEAEVDAWPDGTMWLRRDIVSTATIVPTHVASAPR